ncbi:uncharacterized protein sS8_0218 [Methylocaldum marinum]|uniref:Uncharacterized protein n=1 Tax=Methylocaldum marinum TaxID=1432792 RepID=A0A286P3G4_9GAMM|nr:hypothetical protein [Methylocaldum marinum]BBA32186.1 uncharacterized protein sS8_0218 [Methylocaldum marinum]
MKFKGTREDLIGKIRSLGYSFEERDIENALQIKTTDGAILNWYSSTGTVSYQGDPTASTRLKACLEPILGVSASPAFTTVSMNSDVAPAKVEAKGKVFVVHGHDQTSREQLELILRVVSDAKQL